MREGRSEGGVRAVQLALDVLEGVAAVKDEIGVSELALRLNATKGTIFRHLQTLVDRGYLSQNAATSRYRLGVRSHLLGQIATGRIDLLTAAEEAIRSLRDTIGQTVVLSSVGPRGMVVLQTALGRSPLEIGVRPGSELQFHASAQGKVALAFSRKPLAARLRGRSLGRFSEHTISDLAALGAEIARVAKRGWATAPEEVLLGINALAAPIFDQTGDCVAALALVGSIQFIGRTPDRKQIDALLKAASQTSWNLGHGSHPTPRMLARGRHAKFHQHAGSR
jgi:IclR family transcriptional regulator, KDG regulon repressor